MFFGYYHVRIARFNAGGRNCEPAFSTAGGRKEETAPYRETGKDSGGLSAHLSGIFQADAECTTKSGGQTFTEGEGQFSSQCKKRF
jgi:hypothetical protein